MHPTTESNTPQPAVAPTRRSVVVERYGPVDQMAVRDLPVPDLEDDEVLVEMAAAGVDPSVWHLSTANPSFVRVMGFGFRRPKQPIPGWDVAGTVVGVGPAVTRLAVGDAVFGAARGSFTELALCRERHLVAKPDSLSSEQAAAVPTSGITALQALRKGGAESGQRVLVIGAGGGVGTYAVQLAKAAGAHVTGVCSASKADLVLALGADAVIDYTITDPTDLPERYDLIVDTAGNRPLRKLRRILTRRGSLVLVGGERPGKRPVFGLGRNLRALLWSPFVSQRLLGLIAVTRHDDLDELRRYLEAGTITPMVERTFPLEQAAAAVTYLYEGKARGKVVLVP